MAKRANGEGSIRKRKDGRWLVTMPTGLYKDNGKTEYIYRYSATQAEAVEILRQLQTEKGMGVSHGKATIKTGEWVHEWIEKHKTPKLAPATLTSYRNNFRIHIKPAIGEIPLKNLTSYQIQRMLDNINGKLSTFVKNYNVIHGALEMAVDLGMIAKNPCKGVAFPFDDKEKMRVLTQIEQQMFIKSLEGEYYRPMLPTYLYTGLRMGEAIPLLWSDIDLEKRTVRVNKKVIVVHNFNAHTVAQEIQDYCKTRSSTRSVKITQGLTALLLQHKKDMQEKSKALDIQWSEDSLVFINTRGKIVQNRNLQATLDRIYCKAKIEGATMHTLRHTYATRCFEAGVDIKAISEQLGHANVKTTYNIYVHLLDDKKEKEIDKLDGIDTFIM